MGLGMIARGTTVGSGVRASASLGGDVSASGGEGGDLNSCLVAEDGVCWLPGYPRCGPTGDSWWSPRAIFLLASLE
jgi:hypothetical protein